MTTSSFSVLARRAGIMTTVASARLVKIWQDGSITEDGRTHAPPLPGVRFRLTEPDFVQATRRDAFAIRDEMMIAIGRTDAQRRRSLLLAGVATPWDRLPFPDIPVMPDVAQAVRRLRDFLRDPSRLPALDRAVGRLLLAHEVGAGLGSSCRDVLRTYADACGATYGDPEVGAAIDAVLTAVELEGRVLGAVSTTEDELPSGAVVVDLGVIADACQEAIDQRPRDGSIPRVTISADVLLAVASYARSLREAAIRLSTVTEGGLSGRSSEVVAGPLVDVAILAARGPVVGGSGAADAAGEVVHAAGTSR